ncbi:MAG TPA: T9SS type A sorting domain-containing protein [Ignavibacteriaceae bacterium]|nr:T9SS type A sorting domain-containing protein [Ignavibacteriaceae bacterium]
MKKLLFLFLLLNVVQYSQAYKMNINFKNGNSTSFSIDDIRKLTFGPSTDMKGLDNLQNEIKSFEVSQNYPNPFNPTTSITYQINKPSFVRINVYDIQGSLVKELLYDFQEIGIYKISWDGTNLVNSNVASGVYIYTVGIENQIISKQMILLR